MNGQKLLVSHVKKSSSSAGSISRTELSLTPDKHPKRVSIYQSLEVRKRQKKWTLCAWSLTRTAYHG